MLGAGVFEIALVPHGSILVATALRCSTFQPSVRIESVLIAPCAWIATLKLVASPLRRASYQDFGPARHSSVHCKW